MTSGRLAIFALGSAFLIGVFVSLLLQSREQPRPVQGQVAQPASATAPAAAATAPIPAPVR